MGFFDFVEEHHGVGTAAHRLGELAPFVEAHIARRRTDQFADGVPFHEFGHVKPDHGLLTAEEIGG